MYIHALMLQCQQLLHEHDQCVKMVNTLVMYLKTSILEEALFNLELHYNFHLG